MWDHVSFIRSSTDSHLGCFHTLATVNNARMTVVVRRSLPVPAFGVFGIPSEARSHGNFVSDFLRSVCLFLTSDLSHACVPSAASEATSGLGPKWPTGAVRPDGTSNSGMAGAGHACSGMERWLPLTIYLPIDAALLKSHDVLRECPCLIREDVMDLPKLLIQRGGSRLGGRVLLRIVHLQVPVYEVTLSQTDHLHARKARQHISVDGALRHERQTASFVWTCAHHGELLICQETSHVVARGPSLWVLPTRHLLLELQGQRTSFGATSHSFLTTSGHSTPRSEHSPVGPGAR